MASGLLHADKVGRDWHVYGRMELFGSQVDTLVLDFLPRRPSVAAMSCRSQMVHAYCIHNLPAKLGHCPSDASADRHVRTEAHCVVQNHYGWDGSRCKGI
jgi:hypothetical protein